MSNKNNCPWCGNEIEDLWEYNLRDGDCEEFNCPDCNKKILVSLSVSYDYTVKATGCEKHILTIGDYCSFSKNPEFVNFKCTECKNEFYDHDMEPPVGKYSNLKEGSFTLTPEAKDRLDRVLENKK